LRRWEWQVQAHCVVDAGFSGESTLSLLGDLGILGTFSMNIAHQRTLYDFLFLLCPLHQWLALTDRSGVTWPVFKDGGEKKSHFLATTAFKRGPRRERKPLLGESQVQHLSKIGHRALSILAGFLEVEVQGGAYQMARDLAQRMEEELPLEEIEQEEQPRDETQTKEAGNEDQQESPSKAIDKMKVAELKVIAKELGLKTGAKSKKELVEAIQVRKEAKEEEIANFIQEVEASAKSTVPLHHQRYREVFNGVDLHDKKWYALQNHHTVESWRAKFTLSLLQVSLVNAYTIFKHFSPQGFLDFASEVSADLCRR